MYVVHIIHNFASTNPWGRSALRETSTELQAFPFRLSEPVRFVYFLFNFKY